MLCKSEVCQQIILLKLIEIITKEAHSFLHSQFNWNTEIHNKNTRFSRLSCQVHNKLM